MEDPKEIARVKPNELRFSLPYSDESGDRLVVHAKRNFVEISDVQTLNINHDDIDWLIGVLLTVREALLTPTREDQSYD